MWTMGIRAHNGLFSFYHELQVRSCSNYVRTNIREKYTDYYRKEVDLVAGSWHF